MLLTALPNAAVGAVRRLAAALCGGCAGAGQPHILLREGWPHPCVQVSSTPSQGGRARGFFDWLATISTKLALCVAALGAWAPLLARALPLLPPIPAELTEKLMLPLAVLQEAVAPRHRPCRAAATLLAPPTSLQRAACHRTVAAASHRHCHRYRLCWPWQPAAAARVPDWRRGRQHTPAARP